MSNLRGGGQVAVVLTTSATGLLIKFRGQEKFSSTRYPKVAASAFGLLRRILMEKKAHLTSEGLDKICLIKAGMNRGRV